MELIGLNKENILKISEIKEEDSWIKEYRLQSYNNFCNLSMPSFGPKIDIDFDKIIYYKNDGEKIENNWDNIKNDIKCELQCLGVTES